MLNENFWSSFSDTPFYYWSNYGKSDLQGFQPNESCQSWQEDVFLFLYWILDSGLHNKQKKLKG